MKQSIILGAYGWRHRHWSGPFYPEDLPVGGCEDWRLAYYSNEFNAVLVPADYWQSEQVNDCEDWVDSVHPEFQFFVECHQRMFDSISPDDLTESLKMLAPQLSALVFLGDDRQISDTVKNQFIELADSLEVEVIGAELDTAIQSESHGIWRPGGQSDSEYKKPLSSRLAFVEDELSDLRAARAYVEQYVAHLNDNEMGAVEATIIVKHPQLQACNLSKFRSVLEIMGF